MKPDLKNIKSIGIVGGGPSALFLVRELLKCGNEYLKIEIFERNDKLGAGMPYSREGASLEHITNVSGNEIPELPVSVTDWLKQLPKDVLGQYLLNGQNVSEFKVLPRLLFGDYLAGEFKKLGELAEAKGITLVVHLGVAVEDILENEEQSLVDIITDDEEKFPFDHVVICSGHHWPKQLEGIYNNCYDSPYPPKKIAQQRDHRVAIKGASLTAIDALKTLARANGAFSRNGDHIPEYRLAPGTEDFKMILHSGNGLLPAVRFHLEDSHLSKEAIFSIEEVQEILRTNDGFVSLDHVFKTKFLAPLREMNAPFYEKVRDFSMEEFVDAVMELRENVDPFDLLLAEYREAEKSIRRKESVHWKEMLAVLSYVMNYPAKYFSAEDMLRLQRTLMPLISLVIAFVPQTSVEEMLALHSAGVLELVPVGKDSRIEPQDEGGIIYHYQDADGTWKQDRFQTFVDCSGQPKLSLTQLPFPGLKNSKNLTQAKVRFRDPAVGKKELNSGNEKVTVSTEGHYYLEVPGVAINDYFQPVDEFGALSERLHLMAVPYMGGYNPDYSGLDFCETAAARIAEAIFSHA